MAVAARANKISRLFTLMSRIGKDQPFGGTIDFYGSEPLLYSPSVGLTTTSSAEFRIRSPLKIVTTTLPRPTISGPRTCIQHQKISKANKIFKCHCFCPRGDVVRCEGKNGGRACSPGISLWRKRQGNEQRAWSGLSTWMYYRVATVQRPSGVLCPRRGYEGWAGPPGAH